MEIHDSNYYLGGTLYKEGLIPLIAKVDPQNNIVWAYIFDSDTDEYNESHWSVDHLYSP